LFVIWQIESGHGSRSWLWRTRHRAQTIGELWGVVVTAAVYGQKKSGLLLLLLLLMVMTVCLIIEEIY
jgi:hypothetical protein